MDAKGKRIARRQIQELERKERVAWQVYQTYAMQDPTSQSTAQAYAGWELAYNNLETFKRRLESAS